MSLALALALDRGLARCISMATSSFASLMRYGGAVFGVILATAVRLALDPVLGDLFPFETIILVVLIVAGYAGRGPALLTVGLGAVASARFLLQPRDSFAVDGFEDQAGLVLYLVVGVGIALLGGALRDARRLAMDHAAEASREREQLRITLDSIGDALLVTDAEGRITSMNPVAEALTGWSASEAAGQPLPSVFRIINEKTRKPVDNPVLQVLREGVVVCLANHTILIARDGTERPIDDSASPIRDQAGKVVGAVLVVRDKSEKKRAEEENRRAGEQARTILERTADAFCTFDLDWRFTYVNRQAEALLGRAREHLIGKDHWEEYPDTLGTEFERGYRQAMAGNVVVRFEEFYPPHDRWYEINAYPSPDGLSVYFRDVTARKCSEEEMARLMAASEQQRRTYETALSNSPDFSYIFDLEGRFTYVNAALLDLWRKGLDEAVGKDFFDLGYPPDLAARLHGQIRQVIDTRQAVRDETPFTSHLGEHHYEYIFVPVLGAGGTIEAVVGTTRDITERKRTEEQSRKHAETLSGILAATVDHMCVIDREGRYSHVSAGVARFLGLEPTEMVGRHWSELGLPEETMRAFDAQREQVLLSGQPARHESHYLSPDGEVSDFEYTIAPVSGADRRAEAVVVVSRDVTRHKLADRERLELLKRLETQNAFINAVLSQVPAAIVVADAGTGQILMSNHEAHRIVQHEYEPGRTLDDYGTTYILTAFRPDGSRYGPGDWPLVRAQGGETVVGEEMELVLRDRTRVTIRVNAGPIQVGNEVVAAVVAYHDISDRKVIEQSARFLADASAMLAGLVDYEATLQTVANLAVPIFADWAVVDMAGADGSIRRLAVAHADPSKADLAFEVHRRFPADPAAPHGPANVFRTGRSEFVPEFTDERLVAGASNEDHLRLLRELGLKSYMCVPLRVRGKMLGALGFASAESGRRFNSRDLAVAEDLASRAAIAIENARLYAELKEADRSKDEFLATLAHELRNPLAPIRNVLHLMSDPATDSEGFATERAMVERQVAHLTRLIDDLMDVARISRGKLELQKQVVDLATIVNQAVETARPQIDARGHRMTVSLPAEVIRLEADPTRLEQILWNLLNNAAKYSDPGCQMSLVVELEGLEVVLRVKDTGIGIEPEMLPRIFGMFVQVKDHEGHAQGGLGIGLGLVRRLVEMHGGSIAALSDGPGTGSEFVVRLPVLATMPVEAGPPRTSRVRRDSGLVRRRILVVDDNEDAAKSLAKYLTRLHGQDVRVAHDGPSALNAAQEFHPEVVVLDIGMPGMDGYEVARRLRSRPETREASLVAMTGWGQEGDLRRSREAGFDRHLVKPVDPDDLLALLAENGGKAPV